MNSSTTLTSKQNTSYFTDKDKGKGTKNSPTNKKKEKIKEPHIASRFNQSSLSNNPGLQGIVRFVFCTSTNFLTSKVTTVLNDLNQTNHFINLKYNPNPQFWHVAIFDPSRFVEMRVIMIVSNNVFTASKNTSEVDHTLECLFLIGDFDLYLAVARYLKETILNKTCALTSIFDQKPARGYQQTALPFGTCMREMFESYYAVLYNKLADLIKERSTQHRSCVESGEAYKVDMRREEEIFRSVQLVYEHCSDSNVREMFRSGKWCLIPHLLDIFSTFGPRSNEEVNSAPLEHASNDNNGVMQSFAQYFLTDLDHPYLYIYSFLLLNHMAKSEVYSLEHLYISNVDTKKASNVEEDILVQCTNHSGFTKYLDIIIQQEDTTPYPLYIDKLKNFWQRMDTGKAKLSRKEEERDISALSPPRKIVRKNST